MVIRTSYKIGLTMARFETQTYILAACNLLSTEFTSSVDLGGQITYRQWFILRMLSAMGPGTHTMQDVAEFVGTTRQNAKRLLEPLDKKHLIRMQRNKKDARALDIELTERGSTWLIEAQPRVSSAFEKVFGTISNEDLNQLARLLQGAIDALSEDEA